MMCGERCIYRDMVDCNCGLKLQEECVLVTIFFFSVVTLVSIHFWMNCQKRLIYIHIIKLYILHTIGRLYIKNTASVELISN